MNPSLLEVIYEDNHIIVAVKPFCIPSQGDETGDPNMLDIVRDYIRQKYDKPGEVYTGLVHRIDRPVGGIMVFARTSKAAARLSESFANRKVEKTYWAITEQVPKETEGRLTHFLLKLKDKNIMRAHAKEVAHSQKAVLDYLVLAQKDGKALIEVKPQTGRRHQIRVQLASMGAVIRGDVKYGKTSFNKDHSICLFAKALEFPHPVKEKGIMRFEAPYPANPAWADFAPAK